MDINMRFNEVDLERLFIWVIIIIFTTLVSIGIYSLTQDHSVGCYYLDQGEHQLFIKGDIDWGIDSNIPLDRSITYDEAINIVSRMNSELECVNNRQ